MIISITKNKTFQKAAAAAFWLLTWQLLSAAIAKDLLLPSPIRVAASIIGLSQRPAFWIASRNTLGRIMLGFSSAVAAGSVLAILSSALKPAYPFLKALISTLNSVPMASITILALVWIKSAWLSVFISFLMSMPVIFNAVYEGIQNTDSKLIEMARVFRLPTARRVKSLYFQSVMTFLLPATSAALGFAWKSGISAEIIGLPSNTVGIRLYEAKISLETAEMMAWTAVIIALSICMEKLFRFLIQAIQKKIGR
jgi:NitT/TauT family transport system permease protein